MAVLISVGFLSSWTPYAAASFWSIFNSSDSLQPIATLLPCLFAKSSTAYNPFVYYIFSKTFRREIKQLQCCCGWRVHFFSTDNSAENPVSMMWSGRDNVRLSSAAKVENQGAATHWNAATVSQHRLRLGLAHGSKWVGMQHAGLPLHIWCQIQRFKYIFLSNSQILSLSYTAKKKQTRYFFKNFHFRGNR